MQIKEDDLIEKSVVKEEESLGIKHCTLMYRRESVRCLPESDWPPHYTISDSAFGRRINRRNPFGR